MQWPVRSDIGLDPSQQISVLLKRSAFAFRPILEATTPSP
jgi:hypothetical protein